MGQLEPFRPTNFDSIYPLALQGKMEAVIAILDSMDEQALTSRQKAKREAFYERFVYETEQFDFGTGDSSIIQFINAFHEYWKSVMLNKQKIQSADSLLEVTMTDLIFTSYGQERGVSKDTILSDLSLYSNAFLESKGFYANSFGKTVHLYDLFLWKEEEVKIYPIQLVDGSVEVEVHFMKDFISTGWSHYSTLGRSYTGGWATKEALFAVDDAYDRNTEDFRVSYLIHEGQHFADYRVFPQLQSTDLEYRAKLMELINSEQTTYSILEKFMVNADSTSSHPHSYANYCVIRDVSKLIWSKNHKAVKESLMKIPPNIIRENSLALFKDNTDQLMEIGKDRVSSFIK